MATSDSTFDVIVIGGGPAGLQATLTLARVHRRVLMLDSGSYRNDPAAHMHNVVTHDGTTPTEYRGTARKELAAYDTVTVRDEVATTVEPEDDGFRVSVGGDVVTCRGVVLATGVVDTLPDKPGLDALWGSVVAHCPFCHGHEFAGMPVGILGGGNANHLTRLITPIVSDITVLTDGAEPPAELPNSVAVRVEPVTGVEPGPAGAVVHLASGPDVELAGLFVAPSFAQRAPFADQLGLNRLDSGCVEVDLFGRTSLPGVHAAGDLAHVAELPMPMASVVMAAAAGQMAASSMLMFVL